jgi:hypothetical protein
MPTLTMATMSVVGVQRWRRSHPVLAGERTRTWGQRRAGGVVGAPTKVTVRTMPTVPMQTRPNCRNIVNWRNLTNPLCRNYLMFLFNYISSNGLDSVHSVYSPTRWSEHAKDRAANFIFG